MNSRLKTNVELITNFSVTGYSTRSKDDIRLQPFLKTTTQRSLYYYGLKLYNVLPPQIKYQECVQQFKILLKEYVSKTFSIKLNN